MEREIFFDTGKKIKREAEIIVSVDQRTTRRMSPAPGTLNTITPCAACKLLRRRCAQECPFFPYFSPHEPHRFASVHKVFGASNVSKLLMEVPESQRADAANSLVYEATLRLQDPVYGCMSTISALQQQVQLLEAELYAVRSEIVKHKYKQPGTEICTTSAPSIAPVPTMSSVTLASSSSMYNATPNSINTDYNSNSENITFFG